MNNLEALDAARGGPFRYRHQGETWFGPDPTVMDHQVILYALSEEAMPGFPQDIGEAWKVAALFEAWQAHYDLPEFNQARRLCYLVDHYIDTLTYDLQSHLGIDLGSLWRARRWNTLLALIDRLPRHSLYSEAVANDPEHAQMLAEALLEGEERDDSGVTSGPPISTWTPELEAITRLIDAVKALHYIIPASQGSKGVKPPAPEPRPTSLLEQARKSATLKRRLAKHHALAARLLPHKQFPSDEPPR